MTKEAFGNTTTGRGGEMRNKGLHKKVTIPAYLTKSGQEIHIEIVEGRDACFEPVYHVRGKAAGYAPDDVTKCLSELIDTLVAQVDKRYLLRAIARHNRQRVRRIRYI